MSFTFPFLFPYLYSCCYLTTFKYINLILKLIIFLYLQPIQLMSSSGRTNINRLLQNKIEFYIGEKYLNLGVIGSGSYGDVYHVQHKQSKIHYAVKIYRKIFDNRILALRTLREIFILRKLKSSRIIKIYDIMKPKDIDNYNNLAVILEYLPFDLKRLCEKMHTLKDEHIPKVMYQLLIGLKYLRNVHILHRDLKPENILSDHDFNIKICDFGLARPSDSEPTFTQVSKQAIQDEQQRLQTNEKLKTSPKGFTPQPTRMKKSRDMTCHVVSRWYRAPQLILMQTKYDSSIEMWSVGCILGELISQHQKNKNTEGIFRKRRPLFEGKACFPLSPPKQNDKSYKLNNGFPHSQDDQISKILQVIGSPTPEQVTFIEEQLASNYIKSLPKYPKKEANQIFAYCRPQWEDFLNKTLLFDPRKRMTIDEALNHPLFDEIRNQRDYDFPQETNVDISLPSDMNLQQIKEKLRNQILIYQINEVQGQKNHNSGDSKAVDNEEKVESTSGINNQKQAHTNELKQSEMKDEIKKSNSGSKGTVYQEKDQVIPKPQSNNVYISELTLNKKTIFPDRKP